jgi:hypothetical protein
MDRDKAIRAAKLTLSGMLEKNRHATAVGRAGGQVAPSKYLPDVPRAVHANGGRENGDVANLGKERLIRSITKAVSDVKSGAHQENMDRRAYKLHESGRLPLPIGTKVTPPQGWDMPRELHIHGYWQDILNPDQHGYKLKSEDGDVYEIQHHTHLGQNPYVFSGGFKAYSGPVRNRAEYSDEEMAPKNPTLPMRTPEQSAQLNKEYDQLFGKDPDITKADGGRVGYGNGGKSLGLYSKAAQVIRNQPQAKGSVDQLLAMVSKTKGVKPAELSNAGRPAGKTMSKEELAKHFDDALPKVDVERLGGRDSNKFPQYEDYTLPGGENYREHLLHLSDDREPPKPIHRVTGAFPRDFDSEDGARQYIRQLDTLRNTPGMEGIAESLTRYPAIYQREEGRSTDPNDFKSSHWGTPNVLAHVRMIDRDNGKTLHVEEVQSDWGQEGREKGFHDPENPFEVVNKKTKEVVSRHPDYSSMWDAYRTHPDSDNLTYGDVRDEKPPQGPYVGNTQQWTDLALKHVLMEAAKGGHDRVVFSPGEANADMYGQRKNVSKIEFLKSNDSGEAGILSGFTPNGYYSSQHDVESHADLPKLIGKENAERLLAQPPTSAPDKGEDRYTHTLQGPLTVGGHGMIDYYKNFAHQGALKLLQQHDPSIKPESYDLPNDYKGFALPMTDTARESILKNGFQAFKRGGEVRKADGGPAMFQGIHPDLQGEGGAPLDLYHGTTQDKEFEAFDDAKLGARDAGFFGRGHYLTPVKEGAEEYAGDGTVIGPLHAALKNPYVWDLSDEGRSKRTLRDLQSMGIMRHQEELRPWDNLQQHHIEPFMAEMKKRGHDGVIVKTGHEWLPNGISEVVAFDPRSIKHKEAEVFDPTDPRIRREDGGEVEKKRDFVRDNPGGEWLEGKQAMAAKYPDRKFVVGSITGVIGGRSSVFLPTHVLKGITGLENEVRRTGDPRYDALLSDAQKGGFDPEQKGNKVVVAVNHFGQPYLLEGNTRVAVAHSMGIPKVKAEVRYWNGAENVDGPMHPENVFSMASDSPDVAKATGGPVMGYVPMASLTVPRLAVARAPQYQQQQGNVGKFSDSLNSLMDTVEGFKKKPEADAERPVSAPSPSAASEGRPQLGMIALPEEGYEATGMYAPFQSAIDRMIADAPGKITVASGYRTPEEQEALWNQHAAKYPDPEVRDDYVARAGQSSHNYGLAADLSYADQEAIKWAQENAPKYGLNFRMGHENWHIEPANIWELRNAMTVPGYADGGSAMNDDNQDTSGGNNVESLSLARSLRNIGSGGGDDRVQNLFDKIAAGQQQAQKAYEMAHSNGEFDDFKIGDTFVYKHSKNPTPMKITGFSVSRAESFPQRKRIYNNHVPVLEMEDQDAGKKVNKYPVEAFQENLHKYDFVSGKPRAVKAGGGSMNDDNQNGAMENGNAPINSATRTQAGELPNAGGIRGGTGLLQTQNEAPLEGLPQKIVIPLTGQVIQAGADPRIRQVARDYMAQAGLSYSPPTKYARVDPKRAARIASDYTDMEDNPDDPLTKASYNAMIKETMDQYHAAKKSGLKIEFWNPRKQEDPYKASPRLATEDIRNNHHMWVFPTYSGYGSGEPISEDDAKKNPLLQLTGETWNGIPVTVNDVFRAIHDYYGHAKEGLGFRADGEENAWRAHASMFSPLARMAMTSETRGQNSWLNYGPHGEHNRKARTEDTIFAPQKIGVMSHLSHHEGAEDFITPEDISFMASIRKRFGKKLGGAVEKALALTRRFTKDEKSAIDALKPKGK